MQPLLTIKEAAALLNVSSRTVSRLIASGELPSVKMGDKKRSVRRISPESLQSFIYRKTEQE